jgi:hypothetical protein
VRFGGKKAGALKCTPRVSHPYPITPLASRAAELAALYHALSNPQDEALSSAAGAAAAYSSFSSSSRGGATLASARDARLDVLLNVKYTVKEFDCALTREMVGLIDREADMLGRGRPASSLAGLRTRLKSLFQMFLSDPAYNPGAAAFVKGAPPPSARDARTLPSFLQQTGKRH